MSHRAIGTVVVALALVLLGCTSWRAARLYQSGSASLEAGQLVQARSDLERAARLQPEASEIHNHLGLVHLAAGDRVAARREFEQAAALDCDNTAAQRNLAALDAASGTSHDLER